MPATSPQDRRAIAAIPALRRAARESGAERLEEANRTYRASFDRGHECALCKLIEIDQTLPSDEIARRGEALYKMHMRRMALKRTRGQRAAAELAAIEDEELARVAGAQ